MQRQLETSAGSQYSQRAYPERSTEQSSQAAAAAPDLPKTEGRTGLCTDSLETTVPAERQNMYERGTNCQYVEMTEKYRKGLSCTSSPRSQHVQLQLQ